MKKDIIMFLVIFCILSLIAGSTYSYWQWQSGTNKSVVFNTSKGIKDYITYNVSESRFIGDFEPTNTYCGGVGDDGKAGTSDDKMPAYTTISFKKDTAVSNETLSLALMMTINNISPAIKNSNSVKWLITQGTYDDACPEGPLTSRTDAAFAVKKEGTFLNLDTGDNQLQDGIGILTTERVYTVWIWIDSQTVSNYPRLEGETLDVNIWSLINMESED